MSYQKNSLRILSKINNYFTIYKDRKKCICATAFNVQFSDLYLFQNLVREIVIISFEGLPRKESTSTDNDLIARLNIWGRFLRHGCSWGSRGISAVSAMCINLAVPEMIWGRLKSTGSPSNCRNLNQD